MRIRRLGWAGVEIEQDGDTLLIDFIPDTSQLPCGTPRSPFHALPSRRARWRPSSRTSTPTMPIRSRGARRFPVLQPPREQEAVLTPEEAVKAARMLRARAVTPIHYGSLHRPPGCIETNNPVEHLRVPASEPLTLPVEIHEPGEWFGG